jgi:predicted regulator of Ras-like GTPase activity (Roadblock/LC7/MglB family)
MNEILSSINAIQGVIGSVVFSNNGQCLGAVLTPPYEPMLFSQFFTQLKSASDIFSQLSNNPINVVILRFDAGYLYLRNIKDAILGVLTQADANLSMVSVGCNVAVFKLEVAIQAPLHSASPQSITPQSLSSSRGMSSNRFPALGASELNTAISNQYAALPKLSESHTKFNTTPKPGSGTWSTSTMNLSKSGGDSPLSNVDIPPDAVGRPVIEALLKALARQIGPFAKVYVKEALNNMGVSASTVTLSQYNDLVSLLVMRVTEPMRAKAFVAEAATLLPKK